MPEEKQILPPSPSKYFGEEKEELPPSPDVYFKKKDSTGSTDSNQQQEPPSMPSETNGGLIEKGNIDLAAQPSIKNPETGGMSTVYSTSVNIDGNEILLTRVTPDGKFLTTQESVDYYKKTGKHLGKFKNYYDANVYARKLHEDYESGKIKPASETNGEETDPFANIESPTVSEDPLLTIKREQFAEANKPSGTPNTGIRPQSQLERNVSIPETQEEKIANDYLAQNLTADELYRAGYGKFERGDVDGAQELFQLSLNKNPQNPKALQGLGSVALTKEDYQSAYDNYSKAVNLLPKTVILADGKEYKNEEYLSTLQGLSTALTALGMGEEALQVSETLLAEAPDSYVAWQAKSNAERVLGNTRAADESLKKAKDLWVQNLPVPSIYDQFDEYQKNLETRTFVQQLQPGFDELKERAGQFVASALNPAEYAAQNLAGIENGLTEMKHGFDRMSSLAPYDQFVGTLQALGGGAEVGISGVMLTPQGWAFTQGIGALDVLTHDAASQVIFAPLQTLVGEPKNEDVAVGLKLFDTVVGLIAFGAAHKAMKGDAAGAKEITDAATKFKNKESLTGEEVKLLTETVQQNATKDTFEQLQSALEEIPKESERPIELAGELTILTERYKQLEKKQEGKIEPIKQKIEAEKKEVGSQISEIVSPKDVEKRAGNRVEGIDIEGKTKKDKEGQQVINDVTIEDRLFNEDGDLYKKISKIRKELPFTVDAGLLTEKQAAQTKKSFAPIIEEIRKAIGSDTIKLYRSKELRSSDRQFSSWTSKKEIAESFSMGRKERLHEEMRTDSEIIEKDVPLDDIVAISNTIYGEGFMTGIRGRISQYEFIIENKAQKPKEGEGIVSTKKESISQAEGKEIIPIEGIEPKAEEGAIFYSPNEGNLTFKEASANLKTKEHKAFRDATDAIDRELGLETKHEDAIGDWVDGAENSVFAEITNVNDFETLRYSAALKGRMANQKAVIPFKTDRNGSDILYIIEVPESVAVVRKKLNDAGIQFRTLIPRGKKDTKVVIFDPGRANADLVKKFTQDNGYKAEFKQGTGEFIEGETREAATGIYNEIIQAYESGRNLDLGNRYNRREYQQRLSDISAEQVKSLQSALDRLNKAKKKSKEVRSRQSNVGAIKDPFKEAKEQAEADRELLNAYVDVAKEYVKEKGSEVIKSVQDFAKLIGEEVNEIIEKAYRVFKDESKIDDEIPIPKREEVEAAGDVTLVAANEKAVLKHLVDSRNISDRAKKNLEDEGLKYKPKSQEDARFLAEEIVKGVGENAAVAYAESGRFEATINSLIFATSIDRIAARESAARARGDIKTADSLANKWADFAIRYSDAAQSGGRFISAIYDFYKKSPLGIKIREQKNREKAFENWFKSKEEAYKEFWDSLTKVPQFQQLVKAGAESYRAKAKVFADKIRKGKIDKDIAMVGVPFAKEVWNGAIEAAAKAIEAGGVIADAVKAGVEYLKESEWYKNLSEENKVKAENRLTNHFDEAQKEAPKKKIKKEEEDKIVKKWSEKLKGLPESKKEKFIRDVVRAVVEKGELKYADFKKLLEEATGLGKITEAESRMMEKYVETANKVTELADEVQKNPTPENIREYDKAVEAAERAGTDLGNILYREPNLTNRFTSLVSLNTLGLATLIKNVGFNIAQQALIRFPKALLGTALDYTAFGISMAANKMFGSPILRPETNVLLAQKGYFKGLGRGLRDAWSKIRRGATHKDYFKQGIQQSPIKPFQAWRDLKAWDFGRGEKVLAPKEVIDRILQIFPGIFAEAVGRGLFLGDSPPRGAAEMSKARQIARLSLGVKKKDLDLFVRFPEQQAKQHFEKKGLSGDEAQKKAEEVVSSIKEAGDEATLTMDNFATKYITQGKEWLEQQSKTNRGLSLTNTLARVAGVLTIPYLKIPINAAWLSMNISNPILSVFQSAWYAKEAYRTKNPKMLRKSIEWLSVGAFFYSLRFTYDWMADNNIITAKKSEEDSKKEGALASELSKQYSLNINNLLRGGGETRDGDILIDLSWFGSQGAAMNTAAQKRNKELEEGEMEAMNELMFNMSRGGIDGFTQSVFGGVGDIVNAYTMGSGFVDQLGLKYANMLMNVFDPAMIAQTSRYGFGRQLDTRGDTFGESLSKEIYERSFGAVGKKPETSLGVFGEPQVKEGSMFGRVLTGTLGLEIADTDKLGYTIYEMYNQTHNDDLVPPLPPKTISVDGVKTPLTYYQQRDLQAQIGAARLELVGAFLNNQAAIYVATEDVSGLSDEDKASSLVPKYLNEMNIEEVTATLKKMYDKGSEIGHARFKLVYPEFMSKKDIQKGEQEPQTTEEVLEGMEIK